MNRKLIEREFPSIVLASYGKRLGAFLLDLLFITLVALSTFKIAEYFYYTGTTGSANKTFKYEVQRDSGLYLYNNELEDLLLLTEDITHPNHEVIYLASIAYFYTESFVSSSLHLNLHNAKIFEYEKSYYYDQNKNFAFATQVLEIDQETSFFKQNAELDYVFKSQAELNFATSAEYNAFKNETWETLYGRAINDFEKTTAYITANKPLVLFMQLNIAGSIFMGTLVPLLFFPLFMKHGRSFGKYLTGLAVVTREGYEITTSRIVWRFLVLSILELASNTLLFFIPLLLTTGAVTITKNSRALHDLFAGTYVVNAEQSKVFKNEHDERKYYERKDAAKRDENSYFQMQKVNKTKV